MSGIQRIALILTIIGALTGGLLALFQFDFVAAIFGGQTLLSYKHSFMDCWNRRTD